MRQKNKRSLAGISWKWALLDVLVIGKIECFSIRYGKIHGKRKIPR